MKTTKILRMSLLFVALLVAGLTACQKDKTTTTTDPGINSVQSLASDENQVNSASDEAINDINVVLSGAGGGLKSTEGLPCHATIDSTAVSNDTITYYVTYNGTNCRGNLNRTGQVEISKQVHTHWYDAGAAVRYKYINLHITHVASGKSITLNGQKTYTNVSGGLIFMIPQYISSVTTKDEGNLSVTFDDGTTKSWQVARQITYTKDNGNLVLTIDGFGTADNYTNLVNWGINRNGEQFYIQILQSIVQREVCQFDPCSGQKKMMIPDKSKGATLTFGYDNNDQPITGDECPTKYRVDWYKGSSSGTEYLFLP